MLGQRVGTQQQVLHVLEVAAGFRQTVNRGGRAQFRHGGFRAELLKSRCERITTVTAIATITTTGDAAAHQGFGETLGRINSAVLRILRANLFGEAVAFREQVVDVHVGTAGFVQTVDGRLRTQFLFAGFRAELGEQLVSTRHLAATATGQAALAGCFCKAVGRIDFTIGGLFRAQRISQRVGATNHVTDILEVTGRFLQTGRRESGGTIKGAVGIINEVLIKHFPLERQGGIKCL